MKDDPLKNFFNRHNVAEAAQEINCSRGYLYRIIGRDQGCSLKLACKIVEYTHKKDEPLTLEQVVGFETMDHQHEQRG